MTSTALPRKGNGLPQLLWYILSGRTDVVPRASSDMPWNYWEFMERALVEGSRRGFWRVTRDIMHASPTARVWLRFGRFTQDW